MAGAERIPAERAAAVILAGGLSTRMGRDKAGIAVGGVSLISRVENELASVFERIIISTGSGDGSNLPESGAERIGDIIPGRGPLGGIHSAMKAGGSELYLAAACDMPFPSGELAAALVSAAGDSYDVVMPRMDNGDFHPLFTVYRRTCLPFIEKQLQSGKNKIIEFFDEVNVLYFEESRVREIDPGLRCFENVNTPEDLKRIIDDDLME